MPRLRHLGFLVALAAIVVWSVGPFLWQVIASLQPDSELSRSTPKWLPVPPTFDHYRNVFEVKQFQHYIVNSVIVVGITTVLAVAIGSLCAYALARFNMRRPMSFLAVILAVSMFPQIALVAPLYLTIRSFAALNSYRGLILIYVSFGLPLIVWVMYGYFRALPRSLDEAAKIDGAGHLRTFARIVLPLSGPSIATLGILCFTYWWNDLLLPLVMISDTERLTLPVGLVLLAGRFSTGSLGTIAAGIAMAIVPVLIVFVLAQRYIVQSIASSGLKL
jgi:ABC-type glycerol-3-phosphate transport system permease component